MKYVCPYSGLHVKRSLFTMLSGGDYADQLQETVETSNR